jgi:glucose-1-phosphate adenylyltransferase
VCAYIFQGAWEDLGTVKAFFESSLDMTTPHPRFNFYDMTAPIFTRPRFLPATKINGAQIEHSLISDGCILNNAVVKNSVLGLRSVVGNGSRLDRTVVMGSDYYETGASGTVPALGIGENSVIEHAIIDKNARVGNNCTITPKDKPNDMDHALYFVRDGIVIIPKNGIVPHGTVI